MRWKNLTENKCPSCNKAFTKASYEVQDFIKCTKCGFGIGTKKMEKLVASILNKQTKVAVEDNQEALNNL